MEFQKPFLYSRYDLHLISTSISDLIQRENSIYIAADQIILSLKSIVDQILKLLHFNFYNDLINRFLLLFKLGQTIHLFVSIDAIH